MRPSGWDATPYSFPVDRESRRVRSPPSSSTKPSLESPPRTTRKLDSLVRTTDPGSVSPPQLPSPALASAAPL